MTSTLTTWERRPLESLAETVDYGHTASATESPIGPQFLRITDIQNGAVDWSSVPFCPASQAEIEKYRLRQGDIVFARTGNTTGKSFLINACPEDSVFASYLIRVRPRAEIEPRYLGHFFDTPDYWAQIKRNAQGAGQPGVNATKLKQLEIPLPPLPEQRRIADILDKADTIRRKRQEVICTANTVPTSVFFEMFGDPHTNTMGWPKTLLKELIADGDKINYGVVQPGSEFPAGIPIVRVGDLQELRISMGGLKRIDPEIEKTYARSRLMGDEILVACVGSIGLIALADSRVKGFNIVRAVARIRCSVKANRQYLAAFLGTPAIQSYFRQATRTVSQPTLNIKQIEETVVLLPPLELQDEFASVVKGHVSTLARMEAASAEIDSLFNALVQRAFRGEL